MNTPYSILLVLFTTCFNSGAQPAVSKKEMINGMEIYPDIKKATVFYYGPQSPVLATDNFGIPLYKFFQMRYTGSLATGDQGQINFRSILEFTIRMKHAEKQALEDVSTILKKRIAPTIELLPIPIKKIDAVLVYALDKGESEKATTVPEGKFEQNDSEQAEAELWTERTFTLSLDNISSQLLWSTLEKGQVIMSLCYAFYTPATPVTIPEIILNTSGNLAVNIKEELNQFLEEAKADSTQKAVLIKASATALAVDMKQNADRIKKMDINENRIPPDYAVLDIRCYDFNNELRPDLYAKRMEVIAVGMDGREVKQTITFYSSAPDIYYAGLRFKYAVKMDKPLKYRIVEIKNDTDPVYGKWIEQKSWNKLIDITSKI